MTARQVAKEIVSYDTNIGMNKCAIALMDISQKYTREEDIIILFMNVLQDNFLDQYNTKNWYDVTKITMSMM